MLDVHSHTYIHIDSSIYSWVVMHGAYSPSLLHIVPCSAGCSFVTGTCSEPNTCSCFNGWEGVDCTTPSCPGGCVNGLCNEPFVCTCNEGWLGDDCSTAKCSNSCTNGMCHQPYNCTCDNGWEDENCTTPICSGI